MTPQPASTIAERLVTARESSGLSTAQLARRVGVGTRTLTSWENGRTEPRPNRLFMLAGVLNVTATWLIGGDGDAPSAGHDELTLLRGELRRLEARHAETGKLIERIGLHVSALENKFVPRD